MNGLISDAVRRGVDGLVVSVPDRNSMWAGVQEALDAEIPVVAINSCDDCLFNPDGTPTGILVWIGQNETTASRKACEIFKDRGVFKVLAMDTEAGGNAGLRARVAGCNSIPGINATSVPVPRDNIRSQKNQIKEALDASGPGTGVLSLSQGLYDAVPPNVTDFITFDLDARVPSLLEQGRILATIDQQAYMQGYLGVNYIVNFLTYGQRPLKMHIETGPALITAEISQKQICTSKGAWFKGEKPPQRKGSNVSPREADEEGECPEIDRGEHSITMVTTGSESSAYWRQVKNGAQVAAQDVGVRLKYRSPKIDGGCLGEGMDPADIADIAAGLGPQSGLVISVTDACVEMDQGFLETLNLTGDVPMYGIGGEEGITAEMVAAESTGEGVWPKLLVGGWREASVETTGRLLLRAAELWDPSRAEEVCSEEVLCLDPLLASYVNEQMCDATAEALAYFCNESTNTSNPGPAVRRIDFDGSNPGAASQTLSGGTTGVDTGSVVALGARGWRPENVLSKPGATSVFGFDTDTYSSLMNLNSGETLDFAVQNQPFEVGYWAILSLAQKLLLDQDLSMNELLDTGPFVLWNEGDPVGLQTYTTPPNQARALYEFRCSLSKIEPCNPAFLTTKKKEDYVAIVSSIVISLVLIMIIAMAVVYVIVKRNRKRMQREAESWRVDYSELEGMEEAELIGEGGCGRVVKARFRGSDVAVKSIWKIAELVTSTASAKSNSDPPAFLKFYPSLLGRLSLSQGGSAKRSRKIVNKELRTMATMRHPNILGLMAATVHPRTKEVLLISELMSRGSMQMLVDQNAPIDMVTLLTGLVDVAKGMIFLHSSNLVHGDVKPANILVDENYHCKVADFGFSREMGAVAFGGTPEYMAPEVLDDATDQTTAADVYAYGISIWQIVSRQRPYDEQIRSSSLHSGTFQPASSLAQPSFLSGMGKAVAERCEAVQNAHAMGNRPDLSAMKLARKDCPSALVDIVSECWDQSPGARPTFKALEIRLGEVLAKVKAESVKQNRDQNLLYRMMPPRVAEQLKAGQRVEAEDFDCVTIFFSDVVGYTQMSSALPPQQVMAMMDRLFSLMDSLSTKYNLFKVETIGDAYFCVGNLEPPQQDHAAKVLMFAQEVVAAVSAMPLDPDDPEKGNFKIRIGIHTGAVLGSVVGDLNPRYCLFGDAVNTASRMESTSKPMRIHMSHQAYTALAQQDRQLASRCARRGEIIIKGKGRLLTYWGPAPEGCVAYPEVSQQKDASSPGDGEAQMSNSVEALNLFFLQHHMKKQAARELLCLLAAPDFSLEEIAKEDEDSLLHGLRGKEP